MYYTVYLITNKKNGRCYIGKHQTKDLDDGYMGSGKLIIAAIEKYGLEQFEKKILYVFETEEKMNAKEKELVTEEFCKSDVSYNLCPGGHGGFGYIRSHPKFKEWQLKAATKSGEIAKKRWESGNLSSGQWWFTDEGILKRCELSLKKLREKYKNRKWTFSDKKHSEETKIKIGLANSKRQSGKGNSQFPIWDHVDN